MAYDSNNVFAKILRGERGFRDVEQILRRHPTLVRTALWLRGRGREACAPAPEGRG